MSAAPPKPETTLALILGASKWPDCKRFEPLPAVEASSDAIYDMLRRADGLGLPSRNVKSLFGSFEDAAEQLSQAHTFIELRRSEISERGGRLADLVIYYAGHGDFEGEAHDFYLTVRRTHSNHPMLTSITARELGNWIRQNAFDLRTYLVIDCCFAAAVQYGFMTSPLGLAELKLHEALPGPGNVGHFDEVASAGVALLAAAGLNTPAIASPNEHFTRFTAALLSVLGEGHPHLPEFLSLSDLHSLLTAKIKAAYPDGTRPELRSLQQTHGRVELVGLFPNAARLRQRAERECFEQEAREAAEQARRVELVRQQAEQVAMAEHQRQLDEDERARAAAEMERAVERASERARLEEAQDQTARKALEDVARELAEATTDQTREEVSEVSVVAESDYSPSGNDMLSDKHQDGRVPKRVKISELKDLGLLAALIVLLAAPGIVLMNTDNRQNLRSSSVFATDEDPKFEAVKALLGFKNDGDEQKWKPNSCDADVEYRIQMVHERLWWWEMPNLLPEETITSVDDNNFSARSSKGISVKYVLYNSYSGVALRRTVGSDPPTVLIRCSSDERTPPTDRNSR